MAYFLNNNEFVIYNIVNAVNNSYFHIRMGRIFISNVSEIDEQIPINFVNSEIND